MSGSERPLRRRCELCPARAEWEHEAGSWTKPTKPRFACSAHLASLLSRGAVENRIHSYPRTKAVMRHAK